jgi:hypothetical protein
LVKINYQPYISGSDNISIIYHNMVYLVPSR